jgi:hypothetical protein
MELTRRDALLALTGSGLVASAAVVEEAVGGQQAVLSASDVETILAVADVLYPSQITVTEEYVETYVFGRQAVDDEYAACLAEALDRVRTASRQATGQAFASLSEALRDDVLRQTGADRAYADPGGTVAQRVRYFVVDELLYALYVTPKGAELVGNENPKGYPGGTEAYQRPPASE